MNREAATAQTYVRPEAAARYIVAILLGYTAGASLAALLSAL